MSYISAILAAVLVMVESAAGGALFPIPMPWNNVGTGGITDLSSWNEKPAGVKGLVTVANGHPWRAVNACASWA